MNYVRVLALVLASSEGLLAALTAEQKIADFQSIAALYSKRYAPSEWKRTLFQADPLNLSPWLSEVAATRDDLEYLDVVVRYVASFRDTHSTYRVNSDYLVTLGFTVDVFRAGDDSIVLIDSINRLQVPVSRFPAEVGDELLAVDDVPVKEWIARFTPYVSSGNPRSAVRIAATYITTRRQSQYPKLTDIGPAANISVRRASGAVESYAVPWARGGILLREISSPGTALPTAASRALEADASEQPASALGRLTVDRDSDPKEVLNYGSRTPIWPAPAGFEQRAGRSGADVFWSGIVTHREKRIGIVRIPNFGPASTATAIRQFDEEIAFLRDNTDGLVLDVTRNNGGSPCYAEQLMQRLMERPWRAMGRLFRPTWDDIRDINLDLQLSRAFSRPDVALLEARLNDFRQAYEAGRLTPPLSPCQLTADRDPAATVYTKPVLLLIDEFSTSAADYFPAMFQDNRRGPVYGMRSNGAGGSVTTHTAGFLSEGGDASVTVSMHYRNAPIEAPGYPMTNFTENVGVQPDIVADLMAVDNFRAGYRPWVTGFLDAMADLLSK